MIARGDRANAERLVREAWRNDGMSEDTETAALDLFGALLTAGDHKARMDTLLYGTEQEAGGMRAAKRLGSGHVALAKARIAANKKASNPKALLDAVPRELHSDPGYMFAQDPVASPRREIPRGRAADAGGAEGSGPPAQSRRMVDRAAAAGAQDARRRRTPHRLSDRARRRASLARHLQDRAGIHRGLDRAALPERSRRSPPSILPASASAASTRPRWRAPATGRAARRKPRAARRKPAPPTPRPPSNRPAITASWRAPSSACRSSN